MLDLELCICTNIGLNPLFSLSLSKFNSFAISNYSLVWQALGQYGILCIEDIVNEVANVGPHFKEAKAFLWPFMLHKPAGGLQGSKTAYKDGGDAGNREDDINELVSKMN